MKHSIVNLTLRFYKMKTVDLIDKGMQNLLAETTSLEILSVRFYCEIAETTWRSVCAGVAENGNNRAGGTLRELAVFENYWAAVHCEFTAVGFIRGLAQLKSSGTLESLVVQLSKRGLENLAPKAISELVNVRSACERSRLKEIDVCLPGSFSLPECEALILSMQKHFTLTKCKIQMDPSMSDSDEERIIESLNTIFKLNKHGRRYMLEGRSKARGVALLAAVADDLNCVYYHLRENPALCLTSRSDCIAPVPTSTTTRARKRARTCKT